MCAVDFGGFIMQVLTSYVSKAEFRSHNLQPKEGKRKEKKKNKILTASASARDSTTHS